MSVRAALSRLGGGARALCRRCFPERQLILRQNDCVMAVRIAPALQMLTLGAMVVGGVWTAATTNGRTVLSNSSFVTASSRPIQRIALPTSQ